MIHLLDSDRKKEIAFGAGVLGLVILFALAGEAFLRLREGARVDWIAMRGAIMVEDDDGFTRFRPDTAFGNLEINHLGLTSPEIEIPKPDGTIRLVFLGDSVVLGAALPRDARLAGQVSQAVAAALPGCTIDYVTIAGPRYGLTEITTLYAELPAHLDPDAVVLVTGGVVEMLAELEKSTGFVTGLRREAGWLERRSRLVAYAHQAYAAMAVARLDPTDDLFSRLDREAASQVYLGLLDTLAARIGPVPTVVVENRGRERDGSDDATLGKNKADLLARLDGMSIEGLRQLAALRRDTLKKGAALHGWAHIDPLAGLPPTDAYFRDPMHLTARGVAEITPAVASQLIEQLRAADPAPRCIAGAN